MRKALLFALLSVLVLSSVPLFAGQAKKAEQESYPWLTVRRYEGVTDTKEAARVVQEGFVPLMRELPGFISYHWVDAGDGVMVSVSVFTNKEAEEESNKVAHEFATQHMAKLLPNPPRITAGHVVATGSKK